MPVLLSHEDTKKQSLSVFGQFGEKTWIPYAKENVKLEKRDCNELANVGIGKTLVLAAMGESLENNIDVLKKYRDRYDLLACDKSFGPLIENGIKPDYVMICDCNIPARWLEPYIKETKDIKLIATCYANLFWTKTWLGPKYFYINKDAIDSELIFGPIMGKEARCIPASSNVSNAMLVFFVGMDEGESNNFSGYEKFMLVGYDYSWDPFGKYYAFSDPVPKRHYMTHRTVLGLDGKAALTSENLVFSAKWLYSYITTYNLNVVNCSQKGLLEIPKKGNLEDELKKVNHSDSLRKVVQSNFEVLKDSYVLFNQTLKNFNETRRLICQ